MVATARSTFVSKIPLRQSAPEYLAATRESQSSQAAYIQRLPCQSRCESNHCHTESGGRSLPRWEGSRPLPPLTTLPETTVLWRHTVAFARNRLGSTPSSRDTGWPPPC